MAFNKIRKSSGKGLSKNEGGSLFCFPELLMSTGGFLLFDWKEPAMRSFGPIPCLFRRIDQKKSSFVQKLCLFLLCQKECWIEFCVIKFIPVRSTMFIWSNQSYFCFVFKNVCWRHPSFSCSFIVKDSWEHRTVHKTVYRNGERRASSRSFPNLNRHESKPGVANCIFCPS